MKLLRRRAKTFDIQVQDLTLHITAPEDFAEESRAAALSFWEQLQSYGARDPDFRTSKRAAHPRGVRRAADRAGGRLGGHRRRGRADVLVPGRRGGLGRPVPRRADPRGDGRLRRRLLHPGEEADEGRGAAPRRRTDHDRPRTRARASGLSTTLGPRSRRRRSRRPGGDRAELHARRRGRRRRPGVPAEARRLRDGAALPAAGAGGARAGSSSSASGSGSRAGWRSRDEPR